MSRFHSTKPTQIYVMQAQNGFVKFGSSASPDARLKIVRLHSPVLVRFVAIWTGVMKDEFDLHKRFSEFRNHCEWFAEVGPVTRFVREVWGTGLPRIEDWSEIHFVTAEDRNAAFRASQSEKMRAAWAQPNNNLRRGLELRKRAQ